MNENAEANYKLLAEFLVVGGRLADGIAALNEGLPKTVGDLDKTVTDLIAALPKASATGEKPTEAQLSEARSLVASWGPVERRAIRALLRLSPVERDAVVRALAT